MSINNPSKCEKLKNNCNHLEQINKNKEKNKSYFYCFQCNHIILIYNNKEYCIYKCISKEKEEENSNYDKNEFDPILIVKSMIIRQEEQIRDINEKYILNISSNNSNDNNDFIYEKINEINNNDINNKNEKEKEIIKNIQKVNSELLDINDLNDKNGKIKFNKLFFEEEIFDKYCEIRNKILYYIHKLCSKLQFNDNSFYITLYLADTYLSRIITEDITEKDLFLVILGFFLVSSKYIEDDIFEPEFERFCNIEKSIDALTIDEIRTSEVQCLILINHNLYNYSVFDWINILLLNNGIIFEEEIKNTNELEKIYIYSQKILTLITSKIYFCRYSSMQIAFSIIHLSREKYINKDFDLSEQLYNFLISLYGVEFSDYEECYNIIKKDLVETNELDEEEEIEENNHSIIQNINKDKDININSFEINNHSNISKTINKERKNDNINKNYQRKNKYKISVDSNKRSRYIQTDINIRNKIDKNSYNLISSLDQKKYKLNNNYYSLQNNSIEILDNIHKNKKLTPNIIRNINNNSLNNTRNNNNFIKNRPKYLISNTFRKNKNLILSEKNQKANNILFINYQPNFSIKNTGQIVNNINYINNINLANDDNYHLGNIKKYQNNNNSNDENSNSNNLPKVKNSKNNNEIRSNTNHTLRKALFKLDNLEPIQLNYEYNINTINNNKIKKGINDINKLQNINIHNNKINNIFKENSKLKTNNKEKYRSHLLLDFLNNLNINNIFKNTNEQMPILINHESKSLNKYNKTKKMKILKTDKNEYKNINSNINIKAILNNNKSKKITLNFKDVVNKQINYEYINKFLLKNKIGDSNRFKSLNNNYHNKKSIKTLESKFINNDINNNGTKNHLIFDDNISNNNNNNNNSKKNFFVNENGLGRNLNNIINYKNMVSFKSKLPKLGLKKNTILIDK